MATDEILDITLLDNSQVNHNNTVNEALTNLARSTNAVIELDASGISVSLTVEQFTRNQVFRVVGHTSERDLIVLPRLRTFVIHNVGLGDLNVICGAASIALPASSAPASFYTDGTVNGLYKIG